MSFSSHHQGGIGIGAIIKILEQKVELSGYGVIRRKAKETAYFSEQQLSATAVATVAAAVISANTTLSGIETSFAKLDVSWETNECQMAFRTGS